MWYPERFTGSDCSNSRDCQILKFYFHSIQVALFFNYIDLTELA